MTYLNILEKMKILFNTLLDFKIILIFSGLLIFLTFLYIIKKLNSKRYFKCIVLSIIISLLTSILINEKALANTFNNFSTMFFRNIYFPSVYAYIGIIVIITISTIVTLLNRKTKKSYKVINSSVFILNSVLFTLILNIIAKNKIDVFSINSLYTNTPLVVTLEISTGLFLLWIGMLLIAYVTNCITDRITSKKENTNNIINVEYTKPQELNVVPSMESDINVPLMPSNLPKQPEFAYNTIEVKEPVTAPVYEQPVIAPVYEPVYTQQTYVEPAYMAPVVEPTYELPAYVEPVVETTYEAPVYTEQTYTEPTYTQPVVEQTYVEPTYEQPVYYEQPVETMNYIHVPTTEDNQSKEENTSISFQNLLERLAVVEGIDGNIDDIDIFSDEQYNEIHGVL